MNPRSRAFAKELYDAWWQEPGGVYIVVATSTTTVQLFGDKQLLETDQRDFEEDLAALLAAGGLYLGCVKRNAAGVWIAHVGVLPGFLAFLLQDAAAKLNRESKIHLAKR